MNGTKLRSKYENFNNNAIIPIGVSAVLNTDTHSLMLNESGVL